jgi:uncharacterized protein (TIGR00730 family)
MKNICIFLSANDLEKKYTQPAQKLGKLLTQNNFGLVYGGTEKGLMKIVSDEVQKYGGKITAVTTEAFKNDCKLNVEKTYIAKDLSARKKILNKEADAIVVLVGGTGTLDESTELIELKKQGDHNKPIVFLNTAGFYDGLKKQLVQMEQEGFLTKSLAELVYFADEPEEVIEYLHRELHA